MREHEYEKLLLKAEMVFTSILTIFFIASIIAAALAAADTSVFWIVFIASLALFIAGICMALEIERTAGWYECGKCHHRHIPSRKAMVLSPHAGRTRYLRCPECCKRSWQRKVLSEP